MIIFHHPARVAIKRTKRIQRKSIYSIYPRISYIIYINYIKLNILKYIKKKKTVPCKQNCKSLLTSFSGVAKSFVLLNTQVGLCL